MQLSDHIIERFFQLLLQLIVDRQDQIITDYRRYDCRLRQRMILSIDFYLHAALFASEHIIIGFFQTIFTDIITHDIAIFYCCACLCLFFRLGIQFFLTDLADIAQHMTGQITLRVSSRR